MDGGNVTAPSFAIWTPEQGFIVENEGVPPGLRRDDVAEGRASPGRTRSSRRRSNWRWSAQEEPAEEGHAARVPQAGPAVTGANE